MKSAYLEKSAAALMALIVWNMKARLSSPHWTILEGWAERYDHQLKNLVMTSLTNASHHRVTVPATEWKHSMRGGVQGAVIDENSYTKGLRIVDDSGYHGMIVKVKTTTHKWGNTLIIPGLLMDTGRIVHEYHGELKEEVKPPEVFIPDLRGPPDLGMVSPEEFWERMALTYKNVQHAEGWRERVKSKQLKAKYDVDASLYRANLQKLVETWTDWIILHGKSYDKTKVDPMLLRKIRLEFQKGNGPRELVELDQINRAWEFWRTGWKVGDRVLYFVPGIGVKGAAPENQSTIKKIKDHRAKLENGQVVPLWMLHREPETPYREPEFTEDKWLVNIAREGAVDSHAYFSATAMHRAVKAFLKAQGVKVRTTKRSSDSVLSPAHTGPFTDEERQIIERVFPLLTVYGSQAYFARNGQSGTPSDLMTDYHGVTPGLKVAAPFGREMAWTVAHYLKLDGQELNNLGLSRAEAYLKAKNKPQGVGKKSEKNVGEAPGDIKKSGLDSSECNEITLDLPEYGEVLVRCGQGKRGNWHNIHVDGVRYGWNGKRWAYKKVPPVGLVEAVVEQGITAFEA